MHNFRINDLVILKNNFIVEYDSLANSKKGQYSVFKLLDKGLLEHISNEISKGDRFWTLRNNSSWIIIYIQ